MPLFMYRVPQHRIPRSRVVAEDTSEDGHIYEPVTCPVCHQIHHVNPHTGVVLGEIREWVGLCADIQRRKDADAKRVEAELALRRLNDVLEHRVEAEARERARIWNISQDMLVVTDLEGAFLSLNPAWTTTLGWSENDLVGQTYERLVHSDDRNGTLAEVVRLAQGNTARILSSRTNRCNLFDASRLILNHTKVVSSN
jgi:transcriptional regulator with PAS, ATPase and Fis domain